MTQQGREICGADLVVLALPAGNGRQLVIEYAATGRRGHRDRAAGRRIGIGDRAGQRQAAGHPGLRR